MVIYRDAIGSKDSVLFDASVYVEDGRIHIPPCTIFHRNKRFDMPYTDFSADGQPVWFNPVSGKFCHHRDAGVGSMCVMWYQAADLLVVVRYRPAVPVLSFWQRLFRRGQ